MYLLERTDLREGVKKRKLKLSHFLWEKGILKPSFGLVNINI